MLFNLISVVILVATFDGLVYASKTLESLEAKANSIAVPAPPPLEFLFAANVTLGQFDSFEGPLGTRLNVPIVSANFSDANGDIVARLIPGNTVEHGYVTASGILFTDIVWSLRWEVDGKLAYLRALGIGKLPVQNLNYVQLETDSEVYGDLNRRFIVANITFAPPHISFFAAPSAF
ncbi:unnamed protein product [Somion occarium]|uniref:Uncharacterized protein n=1 Tax=Somion occarium TaxID=3059160 RepID=A0ABP1CPM7_9APHY